MLQAEAEENRQFSPKLCDVIKNKNNINNQNNYPDVWVAHIAEIIHKQAFTTESCMFQPFQMSTEWSQRQSNNEI